MRSSDACTLFISSHGWSDPPGSVLTSSLDPPGAASRVVLLWLSSSLPCERRLSHWRSNVGAPLEWGETHTHARRLTCVAQQRETHTVLGAVTGRTSVLLLGVNTFSAGVYFDSRIRVTASNARIPQRDLRISQSQTGFSALCFEHFWTRSKLSQSCPSGARRRAPCETLVSKENAMERQLSKPECKNMDACLRRLKQELVGPAVSTSIPAITLLHAIDAQFKCFLF